MNRPERIRFFITEQCRNLDLTFRNYMYPRQILLGDTTLPLLEGSSLTFRINQDKKISFRIRLQTEDCETPLNIGIPMTQVESVSIKDESAKHPEPAILFLLKNKALQRFINICGPMLNNPIGNGNRRSMSKYLTVILGNDPHMADRSNSVHCRVVLRANKFTFPFSTAKKMLMKDLPIMWQDLIEEECDRKRQISGVQADRERISEMDDEAWDWYMRFMGMRWDHNPDGGYWLVKQNNLNEEIEQQEAPSLLADELLTETNHSESTKYSPSSPGSPGSTTSSIKID
uniref:MSP domain-containing protein n=1 Tax=Caenorhabditis tropicalis TaxID=1561998 RepID=A0A1I7TS18_9PELO